MKKILFVDDDPDFTKTLIFRLPKEKYKFTVVHDGEAGLLALTHDQFDLVVLDMMMPGIDGITFLKKMREQKMPPVPALIVSNVSNVEKVSEGVSLGVKGYIVKSNESITSIVQSIERALGEV